MPTEGEEWPFANRRDLGNGMHMGPQPTRYITEVVPVSDTATTEPVPDVRLPSEEEEDDPLPSLAELTADPPPEKSTRSLAGWLVDVDVVVDVEVNVKVEDQSTSRYGKTDRQRRRIS